MSRLVLASCVAIVALAAAPATLASASQLTLSPRVVTLGNVELGTTTEETVTLSNIGDEALTLNSYEAFGYNGNFMVIPGTCALGTTTLAPGESCMFSIVTSPFTIGAIRGQFCFTGVGETTFDRECGRIVGGAT
jgi:hypothetical protein